MILDDNLVSIDNANLANDVTSSAIALNSMKNPGREEPIAVWCHIGEAAAGGTSITLNIQQANSLTGDFSTVATQTVALAAMTKNARIGWRFLPREVTKPYVKFTVTKTGMFTAGTLTVAVVREDELPYEAGMYIDGGVVKG